LLVLGVAAAQLAQPYLVKLAIDESIAKEDLSALPGIAALFLSALIAEFGFRYGQIYALEKLGQEVVYRLRSDLFAHLEHLASSFFDRNPVGRLVSRVISDVESIHEAFTSGLVLILADLVKLVGIVVILVWMDWRMALVTFAVVPPMLLASWFFRARVRRSYRQVRAMVAQLNGFLNENLSGMRLVQLFSREQDHMDEFDDLNRRHRNAEIASVRYESAFSAITEMLGSVTLAAIVWAGGWRLLGGGITFGVLVAFIEYARRFFRPIQELSQRYAVMQSAMASAERLFQILDTDERIAGPEVPRNPDRPRGEIRFEGVNFAYREGEPVIRDLDLTIRPGERIGVVGWTGSGKSTLIRLLTRLYEIQHGCVRIDGIDVREMDPFRLRRSIGVVLQDPFLFAGTIASNISLGDPSVSRERLEWAASVVHADQFIERLPQGFDTPVQEGGKNFSVGEKQLLCFARALAFDPAIVVLDEATASVDPATEQRIQEALETLLAGRTSIVVAHRLVTVKDADRILVLHKGALREQGAHEELIQKEEGVYRTLWELQSARAV
jgi:ATP-binding cassette subfamily B protein